MLYFHEHFHFSLFLFFFFGVGNVECIFEFLHHLIYLFFCLLSILNQSGV